MPREQDGTGKPSKGAGKSNAEGGNSQDPGGQKGNGKNNKQQGGKGKGQQPVQPGQANSQNPKANGGIPTGDLEFLKKVQDRQYWVQTGKEGEFPALGRAPPTCPEKTAELKKLRANIDALEAMPEELQDEGTIQALKRKLNTLLGMQATAAGEERESARLHRIMGTLKNSHATDLELKGKALKQAEDKLEEAKKALTEATQAKEEAVQAFDRREARVANLIAFCDNGEEEEATEQTTEGTQPLPPQITAQTLSPLLNNSIERIMSKYQHGALEGSPELATIKAYSQFLVTELSNQEMADGIVKEANEQYWSHMKTNQSALEASTAMDENMGGGGISVIVPDMDWEGPEDW